MFAQWIIGLFAALVATPVAVASHFSARRASVAERQPARALHRSPAPAQAHAPCHRQYRRHLAA